MRSILTVGGIHTFVSEQEHKFLERFESKPVYKNDLNEQDAELARKLTSRGVIKRFKEDTKGIYFLKNQNKGIK